MGARLRRSQLVATRTRMKMRFALGTFLPVALAVTTGCSSSSDGVSNAPPVIDSVDAPAEVTLQNNQFQVEMEIRFHDSDKEAVSKLRYRIPAGQIDKTITADGATAETPGAKLTLVFPGNTPKGTYDYTLTVFDARGAESAPTTKQITLK